MPAPAAPTSVAVLNAVILQDGASVSSGVKMGWSGVSDAAYEIQKSDDAGSTWDPVLTTAIGATSAKFKGLTPGTTSVNPSGVPHLLRVRATNGSGNSAWVQISHTTGRVLHYPENIPTPPVPISVAAGSITPTGATISWSETSSYKVESLYILELTKLGDTPQQIVAPQYELSAALSGLDAGTTYSVRVQTQAINSNGLSGPDFYYSAWTTALLFTTGAASAPVIDGVQELTLYKGVTGAAWWHYAGAGTVDSDDAWGYFPTPNGLTLAVPSFAVDNRTVILNGTPDQEGVYDGFLSVRSTQSSLPVLYSLPVRIYVQGGNFLPWLHSDFTRMDAQIDLRTKTVTSYVGSAMAGGEPGTEGAVLVLKAGDTFPLYVVLRDSGRVLETYAIEALSLTLRVPDNLDAGPLLEVRADPVYATAIGDHLVYTMDVTVKSPLLDRVFAAINASPAAVSNGTALLLRGEIAWKKGGVWTKSRSFPVAVAQDYSR